MLGADASPAYIRRACEASLRRLGTDRIDLYQCHLGDLEPAAADEAAGALEALRDDGLIRAYGWSLDDPERAAAVERPSPGSRPSSTTSTCSRTRRRCSTCASAPGSRASTAARWRWAC